MYIYIFIVQWEILQPYFMVIEVCRFGFYWAISSWTFLAGDGTSWLLERHSLWDVSWDV